MATPAPAVPSEWRRRLHVEGLAAKSDDEYRKIAAKYGAVEHVQSAGDKSSAELTYYAATDAQTVSDSGHNWTVRSVCSLQCAVVAVGLSLFFTGIGAERSGGP
jgi:hypothetical protein